MGAQAVSAAQSLAHRVYHSFSNAADHFERVEFVKQALAGQNLPFEGVQLP
jgi:hypothetical protein